MTHCWQRDPRERPSFKRLVEVLRLAEGPPLVASPPPAYSPEHDARQSASRGTSPEGPPSAHRRQRSRSDSPVGARRGASSPAEAAARPASLPRDASPLPPQLDRAGPWSKSLDRPVHIVEARGLPAARGVGTGVYSSGPSYLEHGGSEAGAGSWAAIGAARGAADPARPGLARPRPPPPSYWDAVRQKASVRSSPSREPGERAAAEPAGSRPSAGGDYPGGGGRLRQGGAPSGEQSRGAGVHGEEACATRGRGGLGEGERVARAVMIEGPSPAYEEASEKRTGRRHGSPIGPRRIRNPRL